MDDCCDARALGTVVFTWAVLMVAVSIIAFQFLGGRRAI
jgi:hypothetical protein